MLIGEGYSATEIDRCIVKCIGGGTLIQDGGRFAVSPARRDTARRYFLMDVAAIHGAAPVSPGHKLSGSLLVPGYGPFYGTKLDELAAQALRLAPPLKVDWSDPTVIMGDICRLCDQGMAMSS